MAQQSTATLNTLYQIITVAVEDWARGYFACPDVVVHVLDQEEDDEPDRYLTSLAVRGLDLWQAAEVWLEGSEVVAINDLGEGLPPDGVNWPWPDDS